MCKAGLYKEGSTCVMCPDNMIKSTSGDATDCDTSCEGESNSEHTACGKTRYQNHVLMSVILKLSVPVILDLTTYQFTTLHCIK